MLPLADGNTFADTARHVELSEWHVRKWTLHYVAHDINGLSDKKRPGRKSVSPPQMAMYVVKLACERPDIDGPSLSQQDSNELARQLVRDRVVILMSPQTAQGILAHHKCNPGLARPPPRLRNPAGRCMWNISSAAVGC